MATIRASLSLAALCVALLFPMSDAFARGGKGKGGGGGGGGGGGRSQAAPPPENPVITEDRRQINTLTTSLTASTTAYNSAVKKFSDTFMKQPEYADLQKAVDDANKALDAARDVLVQKLKSSSPEYKAAVQKETDAKKKLDLINASGGNRDDRASQAQIIMDAGTAVDKLEEAAMAKDASYQDAKAKQVDAVAALKAEKEKMAAAILADPDLADLKTKHDANVTSLEDARKKLTADMATNK